MQIKELAASAAPSLTLPTLLRQALQRSLGQSGRFYPLALALVVAHRPHFPVSVTMLRALASSLRPCIKPSP